MATISVNRQAISVSSRLMHTSSQRRASALSASQISPVEEITLQPIFDIFDAPTRLAETREFIRTKYVASSSAARASTSCNTTNFPSSYSDESEQLFTTLPPPIVFDGPAQPKNAVLALKARMRRAGLAPSRSRPRTPTSVGPSSMRPFSSEPHIRMFDGPARITRYHHNPSGSDRGGSIPSAKLAVALGVASAVGCVTTTLATDAET